GAVRKGLVIVIMQMKTKCLIAFPLFVSLLCVAQAQTPNAAIVGSGYAVPIPMRITPGGLMTIYVSGIGGRLTQVVKADVVPLPTKLAGISVALKQYRAPQGPFPVPLLAVFPVDACPTTAFDPCGKLTGINLQVPFELIRSPAGLEDPTSNFAQLV